MNRPTIVTCYYKISSKRPHENYIKYIDYFLGNLRPDINLILFTSSDMINFFNKYTIVKSNIKVVVKDFDSIILTNKYKFAWESQYKLDHTDDEDKQPNKSNKNVVRLSRLCHGNKLDANHFYLKALSRAERASWPRSSPRWIIWSGSRPR